MDYQDNINGIYGDPINIPTLPTLPTLPLVPVFSTTSSTPPIPSHVPTTTMANGTKAVKWEVVQYWLSKGADWAVNLWQQRQATKTYNGSGVNPPKTSIPPVAPPKADNNNTMLMIGGLGILLLAMNKKKKA